MGPASFKLGAEIEIKTDLSLGMMHLPTSRHRKYPYWNYKRVSTAEQIYVDEEDTVFQKIISAISEYLRKDGYKGYSTNYQDLDIDVYKIELWKLIKDVLRLLDYDIQKLEDQIVPSITEDDNYDATLSNTICTANKKNDANDNDRKAKNIQRNESLDKYRSLPQKVLVLVLPGMQ